MLVEKLKTANIATKQAKNDADVLIVETAIAESEHQKTVVIVGDDIDLLVILIGRTQSHQQNIFFKKIGKGNVETKMYSSKSFEKYPRCKKHVLFLHALSGCDTTSALFRKGKLAVIKMFEKNSNLDQLAELFQQKNSHPQLLFENGERILLQMYNAPKLEGSIDNLRYTQFIKLTKSNKPVQLSSLPPTSAAARQHINRVYYQTQIWLGNDLEPQDWGWSLQNETLGPVATLLPPAPEELLNSIFCNCKKGCSLSCGCRKVGLQCSSACGHCKGQACLNAPLYSNDQDDDNATDIFEMLETTVNTDDENDDDDQFDLQIEQLEEEEEDDE